MRRMFAFAVIITMAACGNTFNDDPVKGPGPGDNTPTYDGGVTDTSQFDPCAPEECEDRGGTPIIEDGDCRCDFPPDVDAGLDRDSSVSDTTSGTDTNTSSSNDCDPGFMRCSDIVDHEGCVPLDYCEGTTYDAGYTPDANASTCEDHDDWVCHRDSNNDCWCERTIVVGTDAGVSQDANTTTDSATATDSATGQDTYSDPDAGSTGTDASTFVCELDGYDCYMDGNTCRCVRIDSPDAGSSSDAAGMDAGGLPIVCDDDEVMVYDHVREVFYCMPADWYDTDAGSSSDGGEFCQDHDGFLCRMEDGGCMCYQIGFDAGSSSDAAGSDVDPDQCPPHSYPVSGDICICNDGYHWESVSEDEAVCVLDAPASDAGTNDASTVDAANTNCPDHAHVDGAGNCVCDEGYRGVSDGTDYWCEPGSEGSVTCRPGYYHMGNGWCVLNVPTYQVLASHPCDGQDSERVCFLDEYNLDGVTDTFCVQGYGLAQIPGSPPDSNEPHYYDSTDQTAPYAHQIYPFVEYLASLVSEETAATPRTLADLFGDVYTHLPGELVGPEGQTIDWSPSFKTRAYIDDSYICKDVRPLGNFHRAYVTFVSQYDRFVRNLNMDNWDNRVFCHVFLGDTLEDSYVTCPDYDYPDDPDLATQMPLGSFQSTVNGLERCLILVDENDGHDPLGICPIKGDGTYDDFVWHHNETICAAPQPNTREVNICGETTPNNYLFKVSHDSRFGLATW